MFHVEDLEVIRVNVKRVHAKAVHVELNQLARLVHRQVPVGVFSVVVPVDR